MKTLSLYTIVALVAVLLVVVGLVVAVAVIVVVVVVVVVVVLADVVIVILLSLGFAFNGIFAYYVSAHSQTRLQRLGGVARGWMILLYYYIVLSLYY